MSGSVSSDPQQYLSGVKRKPSAWAPSIICTIFLALWGEAAAFSREAPCSSALSSKTWLEFGSGADGYPFDKRRVECGLCGRVVMYWRGGVKSGGGGWVDAKLFSSLCSWEMYMWCKHAGSWWKHKSQAGTERHWAELVLVGAELVLVGGGGRLERYPSLCSDFISVFTILKMLSAVMFRTL